MAYTVGEILQGLMQQPRFKERWINYQVKTRWADIVGEGMAKHITPYKLREYTLLVRIDDERWVAAFDSLRTQIIDKVNSALNSEEVRAIEVLVRPGSQKRNRPKRNNGV